MTFEDSWNHSNHKSKEEWREAIIQELTNMKEHNIWDHNDITTVQKNRRTIGTLWVFKIKSDGRYRERLCVMGFTQVPGIHHQGRFTPVISEGTLRLCLITTLINDWDAQVIDIQTEFLYGDLNEQMYMHAPRALEEIEPQWKNF